MNRLSRAPETDPLYARPAADRPRYATGVLLDAQDFTDEQTYHRGRLAMALASLAGSGTLAGLRVEHRAAASGADAHPEEIRVEPGLAIDRLGRLTEVPRTACVRLAAWFDAEFAADAGDRVRRAAYTELERFLSARAIAEAGAGGQPPIPARGVVADVFLRFVACPRGLTPSFATGPFEALDAVATARVRDAYELQLTLREGLDDRFDGLPAPGTDLSAVTDPGERQRRLQDAILDAYPAGGVVQGGTVAPLAEHPAGIDPTAVFLARVVIPVGATDPPVRDGTGVVVDGWSRRFAPSIVQLAQWIGASR
ncbi:MAG: hypothetical protein AB7N65_11855 [Vicinamibacterales bacterium]